MPPFEIEHHIGAKPRTADLERSLSRLAIAQHGVVTRVQLLGLGFGRRAIARRIDQVRLVVVHSGVYAVGRPELSIHGRWMAAVLACGPEALLSYRSAAALWELFDAGAADIDVTVPGRRRHGRPGIRLHQPRVLHEDDRAIRDGIPVTTIARTLLDLADAVPPARLRRALEQAEHARLFDLDALKAVVERGRGRQGVKQLRTLLSEVTEPPDLRSELEQRFLELCRDAGLPAPAMNCVVAGHTVDALWPDQRLVVELDGFAHHRSRSSFEKDRARDADLVLAGHRVIRVTARRLDREPRAVARSIRTLLAST